MLIRVTLAAMLACAILPTAATAADPESSELSTVFTSGQDGYHTYRIPAAVVTQKGTVLVFCEGRKTSSSDSGDIDLLLKRSEDGGTTWSPAQIVHEEGGTEKITIGNPCPMVDQKTGAIHLLFSRNNMRAFYTVSTDDGVTWAAPREITASMKGFNFPWTRLGTGPVHGIQLASGRLVAPIWLNEKKGTNYRSAALLSDDHGKTWKAGGLAGPEVANTNECVIFEGKEGSLCLNMRPKSDNERGVAWSKDGGVTWSKPQLCPGLPAPVCQASALALDGPHAGLVLYSGPAMPKRTDMTLRLSRDGGKTWPVAKRVEKSAAAYSDLAQLEDGSILCFYEAGVESPYESIRLLRFKIEWLTGSGK